MPLPDNSAASSHPPLSQPSPALMPLPNSSAASCVWLYSGLRSLLVSSPASQSKLNLNFSLGRSAFLRVLSAPRYCCLISSSSFSRSRSAALPALAGALREGVGWRLAVEASVC